MQHAPSTIPGSPEGALQAPDVRSPDAIISLLSSKEQEILEALEAHRRLRDRSHVELGEALARISTRLAELQRSSRHKAAKRLKSE